MIHCGQCIASLRQADSTNIMFDYGHWIASVTEEESSSWKALVGRSKMKPLGAGSDPRGQPQSSMTLVMPQAQFLKPPPTSCSVIDSGVPLSLSRALRVGRSIAPKVVSG
jgi:hypothetical protein